MDSLRYWLEWSSLQVRWHEKEKQNWVTEKLNIQVLINWELALKRTKTSAGFFEGKKKPIPLGFSCNKSCSQFSVWEWSRKKMTSPILVMNFYSLLNFKYVHLIPRWSPKNIHCQTIDLDTLLQCSPLPCYSLFSGSKHRAHQGERWPSPGLSLQCLQEVCLLSWCPFTELKHSQPSNHSRDWLGTGSGTGSKPHYSSLDLKSPAFRTHYLTI